MPRCQRRGVGETKIKAVINFHIFEVEFLGDFLHTFYILYALHLRDVPVPPRTAENSDLNILPPKYSVLPSYALARNSPSCSVPDEIPCRCPLLPISGNPYPSAFTLANESSNLGFIAEFPWGLVRLRVAAAIKQDVTLCWFDCLSLAVTMFSLRDVEPNA